MLYLNSERLFISVVTNDLKWVIGDITSDQERVTFDMQKLIFCLLEDRVVGMVTSDLKRVIGNLKYVNIIYCHALGK